MIRTIIFDIGNVLADFNWRAYLDSFALPEQEDRIVERTLFLSPLWAEIDRGRLSDEELLAQICKGAPEQEMLIRRVYSGAGMAVSQNAYAPGLLKRLKELGYQIYILSNYGKTFYEERLSNFEFLRYSDGQVIPGIRSVRRKRCFLMIFRKIWRRQKPLESTPFKFADMNRLKRDFGTLTLNYN